MQNKFALFAILIATVALVSFSTNDVYAVTAYTVNIPHDAGAQSCSGKLNACYNPDKITVNVGDTVTWTNIDGTIHTSTSRTTDPVLGWDSGDLNSENPSLASFTKTFTQAGTFDYYCRLHPWQVGTVFVADVAPILPTVSIHSPTNGDTFDLNSEITFTATADDSGIDVTANLQWESNLDGSIGTGGTFSTTTLTEGIHTITASVTGAGGLGSQSITITVGNPPPGPDPINNDPIPAKIPKGTITIGLELVASDIIAPMHLTDAGDASGRLFIVDQPGTIWILKDGAVLPTPFLDMTDRIIPLGLFNPPRYENDYDERGLLGLAFHPGFEDPASQGYGKLYTYSSEAVDGPADFTEVMPLDENGNPVAFNHQSVIAEWSVDPNNPDMVDTSSRREIMRVDEPQLNHNGGMLQFGPDGYMYVSFGDGGAANDKADGHGTTGNGQDPTTILGSIIRIEPLDPATTVSSDQVSANGKYRIPSSNPFVGDSSKLDEIFAYGFRNVWRYSFDPLTDQLIAADVGQNKIEEIDIVVPGGNYGWNTKEGTFDFDPQTGSIINSHSTGFIDPVAQYDHDEGISITGGYLYRGDAIPELQGKYVFGDFSSGFFTPNGRLFYSDLATGQIYEFVLDGGDLPLGQFVKSSGIDQDGEIYFLTGTNLGPFASIDGVKFGQVLKVVPIVSNEPGPKTDLMTILTDANGNKAGTASFNLEDDGANLKVKIEDSAPNSSFEISIGTKLVGLIATDKDGQGIARWEPSPVSIVNGDVITLANDAGILKGTFATVQGDARDETEDETENEVEDETENEVEDETENEVEDETENEVEDETEDETEDVNAVNSFQSTKTQFSQEKVTEQLKQQREKMKEQLEKQREQLKKEREK